MHGKSAWDESDATIGRRSQQVSIATDGQSWPAKACYAMSGIGDYAGSDFVAESEVVAH